MNLKTIKTLLFICSFALFTAHSWALSVDGAQHFSSTNGCTGAFAKTIPANGTGGWTITDNTGHSYYTLVSGAGQAINDTLDCSSSVYAQFYSTAASPSTSDSITITYTDPAPTFPNPHYLKVDIWDSSGGNRGVTMIVNDTVGDPPVVSSSNNILTNCLTNNPTPTGGTSGSPANWNTVYCDVSSLSSAVTTVQLVFTGDNQMKAVASLGNPVYLDNLRGESLVTCYTATNTPTNTNTGTPTNTPIYSYTFTQTATQTATNTQTITATNTATQSATNTVAANTATFTLTPTVTATLTLTNTPFITNTPTVTNTLTPAPCQPEAYPNPMDFTINHNLVNVPAGACSATGSRCMVFSCVPLGSTVKIYTLSLSLVRTFEPSAIVSAPSLPAGVGLITWDGTTNGTSYVSPGLYFYVVNGAGTNTFGKFAVSKSVGGT